MPAELRTEIGIDTESALQQMRAFQDKVDDVQAQEALKQKRVTQELANISVEEFEKQISAQERLLDQLHMKEGHLSEEERRRVVDYYKLRRQEHEEMLEELDNEAEYLTDLHTEKKKQLDELRQAEEQMSDERRQREQQLLDDVTELADKSRENYRNKTDLVYEAEKTRLEALQELAGTVAPKPGEEAAGGGLAGVISGIREVPHQIDQVGGRLQRSLSPFMRILGVTGIAFSLEQVIEKLYKANEELRVIRNNYAEIAASMGQFIEAGAGIYVGRADTALMMLQREYALEYADALDKKIVPQIAQILMTTGGMAMADPGTIARIVDDVIRIGVTVGDPNLVAQTGARLYREFGVALDNVTGELALLKKAAEEANVPFADLTRNVLALAEQTRVYGFDIEDSRRVIVEFAHELHQGTVTMQDLIALQKATADIGEQQRLGVVAFMDRIDRLIGPLISLPGGMGFGEMMRMVGGPVEQQALLNFITQGRIMPYTAETLQGMPEGAPQREVYEMLFDLSTRQLRPEYRGMGRALEQAMLALVDELAREYGGEDVGRQRLMTEQFYRMLLPFMAGRPMAIEETMREGIIGGGMGQVLEGKREDEHKEVISEGEKALAELRKISEELLTNRRSIAGSVASGMGVFWQDTSESIELMLRRVFGGDISDLEAWERNRRGRAFIGVVTDVLGPGRDITAPGQVTPAQVQEVGRLVLQEAGGDRGLAMKFLMDWLQVLVNQGALGPAFGGRDVEAIARALVAEEWQPEQDVWFTLFPSMEEYTTKYGAGMATPEERFVLVMESIQARFRQQIRDDLQGLLRLGIQDIREAPGIQVNVRGIEVTLPFQINDPEALRSALKNDFDAVVDNIWQQIIDVMNDPNKGRGQ